MHRIEVVAEQALVRVWHVGFYTVALVHAYAADLRAQIARNFGPRPDYRLMIDIVGCDIQSQAVIAAFAEAIRDFPPARRIAIVTGSSLARMQMRRVLHRDYLRNFDTEGEALAWILAPDEAAAA